MTVADDAFLLSVLNDPAFIRYIGDRGVRTQIEAQRYIQASMIASYQAHGFGMYLVAAKSDSQPIGICGLVKRPGLDDVDIGFAFLPEYCGRGYAYESARAVIRHAEDDFGLQRLVAITSPDNHASMSLLSKLGFVFEKLVCLPGDDQPIRLFARRTAVR